MHTKKILSLFIFALLLPLQALSMDLTIRNEENSSVRVALAYERDQCFMVEGWIRLAPNESITITLHGVQKSEIYTHVVFDNPSLKQHETIVVADLWVQDTNFRYVLSGDEPDMDALATPMIKVPFQIIDDLDDLEDQLFLNLNSAAG